MSPLVSVVTTVHNGEKYLKEAIQSVLDQTLKDLEYVIVDDGSTDRSWALIQEFALLDQRIRPFRTKHQGRIQAILDGMNRITTDLVGWVDADDVLESRALEETVGFLAGNKAYDLVYTDYFSMDRHGANLEYGKRCRLAYSPKGLLTDFMTFHFRLFRKSLFQAVRFEEAVPFAEDYDFCLRASEIGRFGRIQKPLYKHRKHPDSCSARYSLEQLIGSKHAIDAALKRRGLDEEYALDVKVIGHYAIRRKR